MLCPPTSAVTTYGAVHKLEAAATVQETLGIFSQ